MKEAMKELFIGIGFLVFILSFGLAITIIKGC